MEAPGCIAADAERADAARNRARLREAARRLVGEHGAERVTMEAVAREAGVGKGTLFRRFGDRDGLLVALLRDAGVGGDHDMLAHAMLALTTIETADYLGGECDIPVEGLQATWADLVRLVTRPDGRDRVPT
jgi:AcrR family transcriptional regulator